MKTRMNPIAYFAIGISFMVFACLALQPQSIEISPSISTQAESAPATSSGAAGLTMPSITSVDWDPGSRIINIGIAPWPGSWSPWTMYVDGDEISTGDSDAAIIVRPNGPVDQNPTGLIVGTLPWVSGLGSADIPCCGSLQFSIPDLGLTNSYDYNLVDVGCVTASLKACRGEWTVHEGDWTIQGAETLEDAKLIQRGNIYIRGSASLTLRNSELRMERGSTPTIHVYIFVDPGATLTIDNSKVYPGPGDSGLTCVWNRGKTVITDSPTSIHYLDMGDGATLTIDNSSMIYEIGGLLQVSGGNTRVTDSTLGALALSVPAGGTLNASGRKCGVTFDHVKVQDLIPHAPYELTFDNVTILEDFTGEYEHGPFERGWIFFLDPGSHVRLSDSELRKIFLDLRGDTSSYQGLRVGKPASLAYRDINVQDVIVSGEWGFTLTNADVTFRDSDYLFLQPSGNSNLNLINSHMVEFIPRQFTGTIAFENGQWTNAGEILGDVGYHSASNNFRMTGSLKLGRELRTNLQWQNAKVTREFEAILTDAQGYPISEALIKVAGGVYPTDFSGRAIFPVVFDENNYNVPTLLEAWVSGAPVAQQQIDFFTETPIRIGQ